MDRRIRALIAISLAAALAACSSVIPDQAITNAFGVDGTDVTVTAVGASSIAPLASGRLAGSVGPVSFELDGIDGIPDFARPRSISDVITIETTVFVSAPGEVAFATDYTITGVDLTLSVRDGADTVVTESWSNDDLELTFSGSAAFDGATTSGEYLAQVDVPLAEVRLSGAKAIALFELVKAGGRYTVQGEVAIDVVPAFPAGGELTFTLKSLGGTLAF